MTQNRSAEATIRGFNYQFAATILLILESANGASITVEGIEDIDLMDGTATKAVQCKYYEGTKLTNSELRDIVRPMLEDDKARAQKITYHLYGHFKDKSDLPLADPATFRQKVLRYTKTENSKAVEKNIAEDLGIDDAAIKSFLSRLSFTYTDAYETHREKVFQAVSAQFGCSSFEADSFYYPKAFNIVAELATKSTIQDRTVTKADFLRLFDDKSLLFRHWLLEERGQENYCKDIRKAFFSLLNVDDTERFFLVQADPSDSLVGLKEVVLSIRKKWSSHTKTALKPAGRYAPYILLRDAAPDLVLGLLEQLHAENVSFVDGYPFKGAKFSRKHIAQSQSIENGISIRVLYGASEMAEVLNNLSATNEIFDFYRSKPIPRNGNEIIRHIAVKSLEMITKIV